MEGKRSESPNNVKPQSQPQPQPQPRSPLPVPEGHVAFRILCLTSQVGAVTSVIQQSTESKIRVEEAPAGSLERVITIIGRVDSASSVKLGVSEGETVVSKAQEALIRVFEALSDDGSGDGTVSCRLLAESSYAADFKSNKWVENEKMATGCEIEVGKDNILICAQPDDLTVKIKGNVLGVKNALVTVSRRLQNWKRIVEASTYKDALTGGVGAFLPSSNGIHHEARQKQRLSVLEDDKIQVVLRILCPTKRTGGVIGPRAVKALQSKTGAVIEVIHTAAGCKECVIRITASQDCKDQNSPAETSPAQKAIAHVFSEIYRNVTEKYLRHCPVRLVVPKTQTDSLMRESGGIMSGIREKNKVPIRILKVEENPNCISVNDRVVEILGTLPIMEMALGHVTRNLLSNYEPADANSYFSWSRPTAGYSPNIGRMSTTDFNNISHQSSEARYYDLFGSRLPAAPRGVNHGREGLSSTVAGPRLGSKHGTSIEIKVSEAVVKLLYANSQKHLQLVKQNSGARVMVHDRDPRLGSSERIISLSGTPDQVKIAQLYLDRLSHITK